MKPRTPEELVHYVAGFEAAVEAVASEVRRGGSPDDIMAFMLAAQHGVRASLTHPVPRNP